MIDLHIHSIYSDGTMSPSQIVADAVQRGMTGIAVCDHNVIAGSLKAAPLAERAHLRFLSGVEIDAMLCGRDAHILCYGADLSTPALLSRTRHARARLDWMSDELLRRMLPDFPMLDYAEYEAMSHDVSQGGWKLLQYLKARGVTAGLKDALHYYGDYGVGYEAAGFHSAAEVIADIHAAGGCAILAHPGVTFREAPVEALDEARRLGIDGAECFYPRHTAALTERLIRFCDFHQLSATAGSDCHGAASSAHIGDACVPTEALRLRHPALQILK